MKRSRWARRSRIASCVALAGICTSLLLTGCGQQVATGTTKPSSTSLPALRQTVTAQQTTIARLQHVTATTTPTGFGKLLTPTDTSTPTGFGRLLTPSPTSIPAPAVPSPTATETGFGKINSTDTPIAVPSAHAVSATRTAIAKSIAREIATAKAELPTEIAEYDATATAKQTAVAEVTAISRRSVDATPTPIPSGDLSWTSVNFPYGCTALPSTWAVMSGDGQDIFTAPSDKEGYHSTITVREIPFGTKPWVDSNTFYNSEMEDLAQDAMQTKVYPKVEVKRSVYVFGRLGEQLNAFFMNDPTSPNGDDVQRDVFFLNHNGWVIDWKESLDEAHTQSRYDWDLYNIFIRSCQVIQ